MGRGRWSDGLHVRRCRLTRDTRLMATAGRLLGSLAALTSHRGVSCVHEVVASGRVHVFGPRLRRRPCSPAADCCPSIGTPLSLPRLRPMNRSQGLARDFPSIPRRIYTASFRMTLGFGHRRCLPHAAMPRLRFVGLGSNVCLQLPSRSHLAMGTLEVRLGGPVIKASKGTCTLKSLPGRLSPSGCQRQARPDL